jgi:uncharacterized membrane protein YqjE
MDEPPNVEAGVTGAGKRLAQRLLMIGQNRLQLLVVELQEERDRMLLAIVLALAAAVFGLLAAVAFTVAVAVVFWNHSPVLAMAALTVVYVLAALVFYWRLVQLQKTWYTLQATLEQLKKDREWLQKKTK